MTLRYMVSDWLIPRVQYPSRVASVVVSLFAVIGSICEHSTTELLHNLVHSVCQCTQNWKKDTTLQPMIMLILCCLGKIHAKFYAVHLSTNGYGCYFANICVNLGELFTKIYLVLPIHAFFGWGNWVLAQNLCCV